jgi:hypothetical protein
MTNKREDILNKVPVWNPITKIGIGMLITSFIILPAGILACWFVFSETKDYYPFIIISLMILFILCMISVGGYLTGKGITIASEIAKRKQELEIVKIKQEEKKKPESKMQEEKRQPEGKAMEIDLLKFNYENLHEAVWNNHKAAWIVTSIFVPILFIMLGHQGSGYYDFSEFQVLIGFFILELLLIIWFSIMRILDHYNKIRFEKLKEIEDRFREITNIDFSQYKLSYREKPREFKFSPMTIYWFGIFWGYTAINVTLLVAKLLGVGITTG